MSNPQQTVQMPSFRRSAVTLLIIEDFAVDREAYKRHLQAQGNVTYTVLEADTLKDGMQLWQTHRPDVVLLDTHLPDGDGLDLLEAMAETSPTGPLPVLVLTGQGDAYGAVRAMKLGAVDYIVKEDITAASLADCIQQAWKRTTLDRQLARSQQQTTLISEIALRVRQSLDLQTVLDSTVEEVQAFLGADRVLVYQFDPQDMSGTIAAEAVVAPWRSSLQDQIEDTCFQTTKGGAYRQGRVFIAPDIYQAGLSDCHLKLLEQYQVRANLVVPILLPQAERQSLWGLLVVQQCSGPRQWETSDVQLIEQLAVQVAIAIQQAELVSALEQANSSLENLNASLEEQVKTRTAELKESRNRFRAIFNGMFQLTGLLSPDGILLEANETALRAGGFPRERVVGLPFWEAPWWQISPQTQEQLQGAIAQAAQGEFVRYEVDVQMAEGVVTPIDFSIRPLTDDRGQVMLLIPEGRDLTEAKRLQAEREEAFRRLQDSERLYASLAAAAPVGIFRMDATGYCTYVNEQYCQITGLTPQMASGRGWQPWVYAEDRDWAIGAWQRCVREDVLCQLECRFQRPDESICWVYIQIVAHKDGAGQVIDYIGTLTDITNRKAAEAALQESEATNRAILSAIPDLMVRVATDGTYRGFVAERRELDIMPQTREAIGLKMSEVLPASLADRKMEYLHKALETNEVQVFEQEVPIGDQTQHEEVRVVRSGVDEVLFIIRDIGERKRAEAERLEAAQTRKELTLLENVLDVVLAGYWDWNIAAGTHYYSPGLKRMFGYEDHELPNLPETWQTLIFPEDLPSVYEQFDRYVKSRGAEPFYNEERYRHKDGSTVWVVCSGKVIEWDEAGNPVRMIGCHIDITQRARLEEEQERVKAQMEQQLAAIESASDGIGILENERYIYLNQAHLELFGLRHPDELLGQSWTKLYAPEQIEKFQQVVFPMLRRERRWRGETVALHQDGTPFPQELSLTLTDNDLLICVCRDIRDRKAAEAELRRTNQELERATRLKDEFLANMSHELRTPLNAILGMSQGLEEQLLGMLNPRQLKAVSTIATSGEHLLELINDILDLSKIESGHMELDLTPVDVAMLCRSSLSFVRQQALKKNVHLHLDIPGHLPRLEADERRLRQVLINLLTNAVKFTLEEGSVTLSVTADSVSQAATKIPFLQIAVTDTGIGIAPEHLSRLFQPFVQVDSALNRKYEGTGLGLALVRRITELHGGQVAVTSEVGQGSCFTLSLPYIPASQPPAASAGECAEANRASAPIESEPGAQRILLAEDNESNIAVAQSLLEPLGFELVIAQTGQEAIDLATAHPPDLILMDIQMPQVDGFTAMQTLRRNSRLARVPIIALTALAMPGDQDRCLAAGADDYVSKPIQFKILIEKIQTLLAQT